MDLTEIAKQFRQIDKNWSREEQYAHILDVVLMHAISWDDILELIDRGVLEFDKELIVCSSAL